MYERPLFDGKRVVNTKRKTERVDKPFLVVRDCSVPPGGSPPARVNREPGPKTVLY